MSANDQLQVVVLSGPNGAGKTTVARILLEEALCIPEFVNADLIAAGLSPFLPSVMAVRAGELMLQRIHELHAARKSFAFETTLASRSHSSLLGHMKRDGYSIFLVYLWLTTPELALERVAARVRLGGHDVPEETVRRRYARGLRNLFALYLPITYVGVIADNSGAELRFIADVEAGHLSRVYDGKALERMKELAS